MINLRNSLLFFIFSSLVYSTAFSGGVDVYEFARMTAKAANSSAVPNDGVTVAHRAYADGKVVINEYVLAIRRNVTEAELKPWRAGTRSEIVPQTCAILTQALFFDQGFHFRFRYLNREGVVLDDFLVNKSACEVYR